MPFRHIFLTGFMGSGKSTVGRLLAHRLCLPFIDLDVEIEKCTGRQIKDIFAQDGETVFRALEMTELCRLSDASGAAVVATGGGIVIAPENRRIMRAIGLIINLKVDYVSVMKRLSGDNSRPLLQQKGENDVLAMMSARQDAYADADYVIETVDMTPNQVVTNIVRWLSQ